jgi:hypothetical protein
MHIIEGKIEVTGRRVSRLKQLLDDLKKTEESQIFKKFCALQSLTCWNVNDLNDILVPFYWTNVPGSNY